MHQRQREEGGGGGLLFFASHLPWKNFPPQEPKSSAKDGDRAKCSAEVICSAQANLHLTQETFLFSSSSRSGLPTWERSFFFEARATLQIELDRLSQENALKQLFF